MTKKRKLIIILFIFILLASVAGGVIYYRSTPYIKLANNAKELVKEDYTFEASGYISIHNADENKEFLNLSGDIEGEKKDSGLHLGLINDGKKYVDLYVDADGECIFDLKGICDYGIAYYKENPVENQLMSSLLDKLCDKVDGMENVSVSLEQLAVIADIELPDIKELMQNIKENGVSSIDIKRVEKPDKSYLAMNFEHMEFFEIKLDDEQSDWKVTVGIYNEKNKSSSGYILLEHRYVTVELDFEYNMNSNIKIDVPETTFSDLEIQLYAVMFRMIFEKVTQPMGR